MARNRNFYILQYILPSSASLLSPSCSLSIVMNINVWQYFTSTPTNKNNDEWTITAKHKWQMGGERKCRWVISHINFSFFFCMKVQIWNTGVICTDNFSEFFLSLPMWSYKFRLFAVLLIKLCQHIAVVPMPFLIRFFNTCFLMQIKYTRKYTQSAHFSFLLLFCLSNYLKWCHHWYYARAIATATKTHK